jgi:hypothetical protein
MRSLISIACFVLLCAACGTTAVPASPVSTASPASAASPTPAGIRWEEYHSDDLAFSLQLPDTWEARRAGPSEGTVLRAEGGADGSMIVTIDTASAELTFEEYIDATFRSLIESNPDAVQTVNLPGGRAAVGASTSTRSDGGVSVIYAFAPRGDHAKLISFTWAGAEPNPIWPLIAERFNAYSPRPIIPFGTPRPGG